MIITVTLNNTKNKEYDLSVAAQVTLLRRLISQAIIKNDITLLNVIKNQLELSPNKSILEIELLKQISVKYPTLGQALEQIPEQAPEQIPEAILPAIHESGEMSFQEVYIHLMTDIAQYTGDIQYMICFSALVVNMFTHIATFTPQDGHGKAQLREYNNKSQLQYYRSQGNHPAVQFFKQLIKTDDSSTVCRLPFNSGFIKLIHGSGLWPGICAQLKNIDMETGYSKPGKTVSSYVMTDIAHAGARKNNLSTLIQGMSKSANTLTISLLREKLGKIIPPTRKIVKLDPTECKARINALLDHFKKLDSTKQLDEKLSSNLLEYRIKRVNMLREKILGAQLKHISINDKQLNITSLLIRFYPNCQRTDDTYKEGVTNVLLSFFGGILNHSAQQRGLCLHAERRQSFGFLRPTLSDIGLLSTRLSLGLEPYAFDDLVLDSLKKLDILLDRFKFDQNEHESVCHVFEYCTPVKEKEEGQRKPRDPDTYIRNIVRKDNATLTTFCQAKAYIDKAEEEKKGPNYLEQAMSNFLKNYVREKIELPLNSKYKATSTAVQMIDSPCVNLLRNTLNYAITMVTNPEFQKADQLLHSTLHILDKLFKNCYEAQILLSQIAKMEATKFYHQALGCIENILEYLIVLDALQKKSYDPIAKLRAEELSYTSNAFQIPLNKLALFFTDSGQQAITTTLLTLSISLHGQHAKGKHSDGEIYLFGNGYYEVPEFFKDCKTSKVLLETTNIACAKIGFIDFNQLHLLKLENCKMMKALVIDITHHPLYDQVELKKITKEAHKRGMLITLVESTLKHGQLGLDKYQIGKIITMEPPGETLLTEAYDFFTPVSNEAIHPLTASYLSMVNAITREKISSTLPEEDKVSTKALAKIGFMKPLAITPKLEKPLSGNLSL